MPPGPSVLLALISGARMLLISFLLSVNSHTGSTPYVTPPLGSVATSGTGMNGHELGSCALNDFQSYCGQLQVLGSISENLDEEVGTDDVGTGAVGTGDESACAAAAAITNVVIRMREAKMRRIVRSWN